MNEQTLISIDTINPLPDLDCGACGFRTCGEFATLLTGSPEEIKRCIHINGNKQKKEMPRPFPPGISDSMGESMGWMDNLQRPFDFILDCFDNEPGPRETILPYNPALIKELNVKKGDINRYRNGKGNG